MIIYPVTPSKITTREGRDTMPSRLNTSLKIIALAAVAVTVTAGVALYANQQGHKDDQKSMDAMKAAYKSSMESANPGAFAGYLAKDFQGFMPTGTDVAGPEGFSTYVRAMGKLLDIGGTGKYTVNLYGTTLFDKPQPGSAHSFGTTKETLVTPKGQKQFISVWYAYSRQVDDGKGGKKWEIYEGGIEADPIGEVFGRKDDAAGQKARTELSALAQKAIADLKAAAETPKK